MKVCFTLVADIPEEMAPAIQQQLLDGAIVADDLVKIGGVTAVRDPEYVGAWTITNPDGSKFGFGWVTESWDALNYLTRYLSQSPKPMDGQTAMSILNRTEVRIEKCAFNFNSSTPEPV